MLCHYYMHKELKLEIQPSVFVLVKGLHILFNSGVNTTAKSVASGTQLQKLSKLALHI